MTHSKLASLSIASLLCLSVIVPALTVASAPAAAANNSDTADTYVVEQDGQCIQLEPHGNGSETVESFYDYRNPETEPQSWTYSSHGTTDIQENQASKLFVYDGSEGTSLVFLHDRMGEDEPNGSTVTMDITQLPDGSWAVQDDGYQNESQDDEWDIGSSSASVDWMWAPNRSDGGAYRGLHNMNAEDSVVIDPGFNEEADNWNTWTWAGDSGNRTTEWVARSGDGTETALDMSQRITVERGICGPDETSPTANAGASPTTAGPGDTIQFDASDSTDNLGISGYEWDFDSDGTVDATGETATHSYEANGSYDATLTVTDDAGNEDTDTVTVTVEAGEEDAPPTADLTGPGSATAGEDVTFDASGSSDDGGIAEYRWDVDGDGSVDETTTDPSITRSFSETGDHTVTVTVVDASDQTSSATATVTVESNGDDSGGNDGSDGGPDDSDDSDSSDDSDDSSSESSDTGSHTTPTTNTAPATDGSEGTPSASASRSDDGRIVVSVENATAGEAVSADVSQVGNTGLRSIELVPANDAGQFNVTLSPRDDVSAPNGTDAGLYQLSTQNGPAVESVTYQFAVDRSELGDAGELRVLAGDGSDAAPVEHTVVENGSTVVVEATADDVDRVVVAMVAPDVSASSITTDGEATTGEPVTVETTLTNDGHAAANRTVELTVDGTVVDSKNVTVPAKGEASVSFETQFDSAGDRRVSVAGTERTISVTSPDGEADTDQPTATVTDDDSSSNATEVSDEASAPGQNTTLAVAGFGVLVIGAAALIRVL